MKYVKLFEAQVGLKLKINGKNIVILCLIIFSFMPPLVEAKTAGEWNDEGAEFVQAGNYSEAIDAYNEALKINP